MNTIKSLTWNSIFNENAGVSQSFVQQTFSLRHKVTYT